MTIQRILVCQLIKRAARCWAGYEPVPGKKPYSEDSCRPVGGKKKKKVEKKAASPPRTRTSTDLPPPPPRAPTAPPTAPPSAPPAAAQVPQGFSPTPFDAPHMIQTLGLPSGTKPEIAYNRAMRLWKTNKFTPAQYSALHKKYQGQPPHFSPAPAAPATQTAGRLTP